VGLFNIMQEGDVQIKGYPVRLPLDVVLAFTANPEDYTARGKIITPLKDRIGSEIRTHYPRAIPVGVAITAQEAWTERGNGAVRVPEFMRELIERIAFEAREDRRVDRRSGVSQRLPISALENAVSNAERRALAAPEARPAVRVSDVYAAAPAITGKLELEYEGELVGGETIARDLIRRAAGGTLEERLGAVEVERVVAWFDGGNVLRLTGEEPSAAGLKAFATVDGLLDLVRVLGVAPENDAAAGYAACELVLEGLAAMRRITRNDDQGWTRLRPERPPPRRRPDQPGP
jgi:magnesium chelatase subunit I